MCSNSPEILYRQSFQLLFYFVAKLLVQSIHLPTLVSHKPDFVVPTETWHLFPGTQWCLKHNFNFLLLPRVLVSWHLETSYTLSEAWSGVNWADLMAAHFYDRSTRTIVGTMLWTEYRPVIKMCETSFSPLSIECKRPLYYKLLSEVEHFIAIISWALLIFKVWAGKSVSERKMQREGTR